MFARVHCVVLKQSATTPPPHLLWGVCWGLVCVSWCFGGHSVRETPGYIPNPEAKPFSADGTAGGTLWESRTPPNNHSKGLDPELRFRVQPFFVVRHLTFTWRDQHRRHE